MKDEIQFTLVWRGKLGKRWSQEGEIYPFRDLAEAALTVQRFKEPNLIHEIAEIKVAPIEPAKATVTPICEAEEAQIGGAA